MSRLAVVVFLKTDRTPHNIIEEIVSILEMDATPATEVLSVSVLTDNGDELAIYTPERGIAMKVRILMNDKGNPPGKLADAELHFEEGPLKGLRLIGFACWASRGEGKRNVTFPARQYSVAGERRSYALLRPIEDSTAQEKVRDLILEAYAAEETK